MKWILIFLILLPSSLSAFDKWDEVDITMETAFIGLLAYDTLQTLDIKNHNGMYETNIILGEHPSDSKIIIYSISSAVLQFGIAHILPSDWRKAWIASGITLEAHCCYTNKRNGLTIRIPIK